MNVRFILDLLHETRSKLLKVQRKILVEESSTQVCYNFMQTSFKKEKKTRFTNITQKKSLQIIQVVEVVWVCHHFLKAKFIQERKKTCSFTNITQRKYIPFNYSSCWSSCASLCKWLSKPFCRTTKLKRIMFIFISIIMKM